MLGKVIIVPEKEYLEWVNKVDSVKTTDSLKTDSLKTGTVKSDSLKTTQLKPDTTKNSGGKKDSIKIVQKDSLKRKENK